MARLGFACKIIWAKTFSTQELWALPSTKNVLLPVTSPFFRFGSEVRKYREVYFILKILLNDNNRKKSKDFVFDHMKRIS